MDLERSLEENSEGYGDPVTALYLPRGFVVVQSYPFARHALAWIVGLVFGEHAGAIQKKIDEKASSTLGGLRRLSKRLAELERTRVSEPHPYDPERPIPAIAALRVEMRKDTLTLLVMRSGSAGHASITIRPHNARRDRIPSGPPLVGIDWFSGDDTARDEMLRLPETLGAGVCRDACAWRDTRDTGLTTVLFRVDSPNKQPLAMSSRWEIHGIKWPAWRGGIACFGTGHEIRHLVTLPKELASPLVHRVADSRIVLCGEDYYLDGTPRAQVWQRFPRARRTS